MIEIKKDYPLEKLVFSEENPRQIKKSKFAELRQSLKDLPEMTEVREIVVDENDKILGGHQRVRALLANGIKSATVKRLVGWTDDAKRQFMIKDNSHAGEWDSDIIANQWDVEQINDWGVKVPEVQERLYYGDEREKTYKEMNLAEYDETRASNKYQLPTLEPCDYVPEKLIGFNEAKTAQDFNVGVHFFIDDYQFSRVWRSPKKYIELLSKFDCIFTPDFSLYMDMPLAMKIWNSYRSRLIGQMAQDQGLRVIPTLIWAGDDTLDFVFDGLPKNSTVAVSTVGVMRDEEAKKIWCKGMTEAIKQLQPKTILLYGSEIDFDFGDIKTKLYSAKRFNNV